MDTNIAYYNTTIYLLNASKEIYKIDQELSKTISLLANETLSKVNISNNNDNPKDQNKQFCERKSLEPNLDDKVELEIINIIKNIEDQK